MDATLSGCAGLASPLLIDARYVFFCFTANDSVLRDESWERVADLWHNETDERRHLKGQNKKKKKDDERREGDAVRRRRVLRCFDDPRLEEQKKTSFFGGGAFYFSFFFLFFSSENRFNVSVRDWFHVFSGRFE